MAQRRTKKKAKALTPNITKDMNLGQLAKRHPKVAVFLQEEYGLHCVSCFANVFDTLEAGMRVHGYKDNDIRKAVKSANALLDI